MTTRIPLVLPHAYGSVGYLICNLSLLKQCEGVEQIVHAVAECSSSYKTFREKFEPIRNSFELFLLTATLDKPEGYLSHLGKLLEIAELVLCRMDWLVSNQRIEELGATLKNELDSFRGDIDSISNHSFFEKAVQEIRILEHQFSIEKSNKVSRDENQEHENNTQNTQKDDEPFQVELDEENGVLYFGDEVFETLTSRHINFLKVLVENWHNGNSPMKVNEIARRSGEKVSGGFIRDAFILNRGGKKIHPVNEIIEQFSKGFYRFRHPRFEKTCS